jgi:hypothetical protein
VVRRIEPAAAIENPLRGRRRIMMRRKNPAAALMAFIAIPFLAACGEDGTGPTGPLATPPALSFSAGIISVGLGQTVQLSNLLTFQQGTPLDGITAAEWESSDDGTVSVSPAGAVLGIQCGFAVITVRHQGQYARITVEVVEDWVDDPPLKELKA